jgi:hypothetical protein
LIDRANPTQTNTGPIIANDPSRLTLPCVFAFAIL